MVLGVNPSAQVLEGPSVVGRKDAAYKGDDGQGMPAVITDCIEIPPEITTRRDGLVESR